MFFKYIFIKTDKIKPDKEENYIPWININEICFFHLFIKISNTYSTSFTESIYMGIVINIINTIPLSSLLDIRPEVAYI